MARCVERPVSRLQRPRRRVDVRQRFDHLSRTKGSGARWGAARFSCFPRARRPRSNRRVRSLSVKTRIPPSAQATGRAFEQGDLDCWTSSSPRPAVSLRRIAQQLAVYRTGNRAYGRSQGGWAQLKNDIKSGVLDLQTPRTVFDRWHASGVLLLNTGLTLTCYRRGGHPHQTRGHIPLWAPVVRGICLHIAQREDIPIVFSAGARRRASSCAVRALQKAALVPSV